MQQLSKSKRTGLGQIPIEWNVYKGDEIFVISSGVSPTDVIFENSGNSDTLYVKVDDMNLPINSKYIKDSKLKFQYRHNSKIPVADTNSIIFPKRGAAILTNKVRIVGRRCTVDPNIMVLSCKASLFPDFMYYHLVNFKLFNIMENAGLPQLNNKDLYPKKFVIPPLKEQQKIASILSNVDSLIQKKDQIIEQTRILKKGLMQRLLTKGIGHTKFKKTKLGPIPETWMASTIGLLAELFVPMRDKPKEFDGNIPWLRIEDLDEKFATDSKSNQRVSKGTVKKMNLRIYPIGTVLCSCSATIGVCAITTRELITNQTFIGIYPKPELNNEFLYYYLSTQKNNLIKIGSGSTIPYISREKFESFPIVLPPINEQQKIASILSNVDELIKQQQNNKTNLENLKKGLMQQLLTGKIRVKV